jgi:chemotaxis protein CheC
MLTPQQTDALSEVVNIGFARAAASLSELTGQRVLLDPPRISIHPIHEISTALSGYLDGDIATVHQVFTGSVAGDALLVLSYQDAALLSKLMTDNAPHPDRLDASDREVLMETGNVLLSACLGTFGNLLHVHITFTVPRLHLESLDGLLDTLIIGSEELRYGMVIFTNFRLRDEAVTGYLVIVLGVASLDRLVQDIEKLG